MDTRGLKNPRLGYEQSKDRMREDGHLGMYKGNALLNSKEFTEFTNGKFLA